MYNPLILPELREMLAGNDQQGLAEVMTELHPATIADFSEGLSVEDTWQLLSSVAGREAGRGFCVLSIRQASRNGWRRWPRADVEALGSDVA